MRVAWLLASAAAALVCAACTSRDAPPARDAAPPRTVVTVDGGDAAVVGTAAVRATVVRGGTLEVRHGGTDRGARSVNHLFTSDRRQPQVFLRGSPNAAVWGPCVGGAATAATTTCPVLPIEAPRSWDGTDYLSLGAVLPGEVRTVALSDALPVGTELRLWCRLHPSLEVVLEIGEEPRDGIAPPPVLVDPPAPTGRQVVVAPQVPGVELLRYLPSTVTVAAGETVTWSVPGTAPHTVELAPTGADVDVDLLDGSAADAQPSAPAGGWDGQGTVRSGFLSADPGAPGGRTFSLRFLRAGSYDVRCRFHPGMRGRVVVTATGAGPG